MGLFLQESRSTEPWVFSPELAAAGDERFVCVCARAVGAGWARHCSQCKPWFHVFRVFLRFSVTCMVLWQPSLRKFSIVERKVLSEEKCKV